MYSTKETKCKSCGYLSNNLEDGLCYLCKDKAPVEDSPESIIPTALTVLHPQRYQRSYQGHKLPWVYGAISKTDILKWPVPGNLTSISVRHAGSVLAIQTIEGSNFLWDTVKGLQTLP